MGEGDVGEVLCGCQVVADGGGVFAVEPSGCCWVEAEGFGGASGVELVEASDDGEWLWGEFEFETERENTGCGDGVLAFLKPVDGDGDGVLAGGFWEGFAVEEKTDGSGVGDFGDGAGVVCGVVDGKIGADGVGRSQRVEGGRLPSGGVASGLVDVVGESLVSGEGKVVVVGS